MINGCYLLVILQEFIYFAVLGVLAEHTAEHLKLPMFLFWRKLGCSFLFAATLNFLYCWHKLHRILSVNGKHTVHEESCWSFFMCNSDTSFCPWKFALWTINMFYIYFFFYLFVLTVPYIEVSQTFCKHVQNKQHSTLLCSPAHILKLTNATHLPYHLKL